MFQLRGAVLENIVDYHIKMLKGNSLFAPGSKPAIKNPQNAEDLLVFLSPNNSLTKISNDINIRWS